MIPQDTPTDHNWGGYQLNVTAILDTLLEFHPFYLLAGIFLPDNGAFTGECETFSSENWQNLCSTPAPQSFSRDSHPSPYFKKKFFGREIWFQAGKVLRCMSYLINSMEPRTSKGSRKFLLEILKIIPKQIT